MSRTRALIWLLPPAGAVATVVVYRDVHASEAGLYAGAEPTMAAPLVSAPFVALVLAQAGCVTAAFAATTARGRRAWTVAAVVFTALSLLGALWAV